MIVLYSGCQIYINPAKKWPKLVLIGQNSQKWPKFKVIRGMLSCTSNESCRQGEFKYRKKVPEIVPNWLKLSKTAKMAKI